MFGYNMVHITVHDISNNLPSSLCMSITVKMIICYCLLELCTGRAVKFLTNIGPGRAEPSCYRAGASLHCRKTALRDPDTDVV